MIDESKIIFFTGAPGSKWSAVSVLLAKNNIIKINTSDRSEQRIYNHGEQFNNVSHLGAYWGPGMEFGEKFDNLYDSDKQYVLDEISKPFTNTEDYLIIKCHQFVNSLDWIVDNFPKSKIVCVMRPPNSCWDGWYGVGGIDIPYPDYKGYYKTNENANKLINQECNLVREWIYNKNLNVHTATQRHWSDIWQLDFNDKENIDYSNSLIGKQNKTKLKYDVQISYYNFQDIDNRL